MPTIRKTKKTKNNKCILFVLENYNAWPIYFRAWDGRILVVASTDGYCSLISFDKDELGTPYKDQIVQVRHKTDMETIDKKDKKSEDKKQISQTTVTQM